MAALIALADRARTSSYRVAMRVAPLRVVFLDRQRRLTALCGVSLSLATLLALREPVASLFFGAALLGVPHLIAGARHVGVRRKLGALTWCCAAGAFAVGLVVVTGTGGEWAWPVLISLMGLGAVWEARGRPLISLAVAGLTATMALVPLLSILAVSHLHAASSLAWVAKASRQRGLTVWPLVAAAALLTALALSGALDPLMSDTPWVPERAFQSILDEIQLTGFGAGPVWLKRAVFIYALGQSLHYAVWLRLMPEVDRSTPNPKPFAAQLASLRVDLGRWFWPALGVAAIAAPAMLLGQGTARQLYFTLSFFHVGLEAAGLLALIRTAPPPR